MSRPSAQSKTGTCGIQNRVAQGFRKEGQLFMERWIRKKSLVFIAINNILMSFLFLFFSLQLSVPFFSLSLY